MDSNYFVCLNFGAGVQAEQYLALMMTLAMMRLVFHLGQYIFKTAPWMKAFSQKHEIKDIKGEKNQAGN